MLSTHILMLFCVLAVLGGVFGWGYVSGYRRGQQNKEADHLNQIQAARNYLGIRAG